jgi:hypothetical protein
MATPTVLARLKTTTTMMMVVMMMNIDAVNCSTLDHRQDQDRHNMYQKHQSAIKNLTTILINRGQHRRGRRLVIMIKKKNQNGRLLKSDSDV